MKKGFIFLLLGVLLIGVALFLVTANLMGWESLRYLLENHKAKLN